MSNEIKTTNEILKSIENQNKMIISLLGRLSIPEKDLIAIIQKKSKKPKEILNAYNLCDGNLTITEVAKKAGIAQSSLSEAIPKWEKLGIIFSSITENHEVKPIHLYEITLEEQSKKD